MFNTNMSIQDKIKKNIDIEYKPLDVMISTMTITCKLDLEFNVINIAKNIELNENGIVETICGKDIKRTKMKLKKSSKNKKKKNHFYNQVTLKINTNNDKIINVKLFINGSIQMTGCKSIDGIIEVLTKLINILKDNKDILEENKKDFKYVSNISKLYIDNIDEFKVAMINSNFSIGFIIDRYKLFISLVKDNIDTTYDPIIHAGVIIRYNINGKIISIFVFESGSIVITGARTCKQINIAYNFINVYLLKNYKYIVKNNNLSNSILNKYLKLCNNK